MAENGSPTEKSKFQCPECPVLSALEKNGRNETRKYPKILSRGRKRTDKFR
jgi:hypothetical protein